MLLDIIFLVFRRFIVKLKALNGISLLSSWFRTQFSIECRKTKTEVITRPIAF